MDSYGITAAKFFHTRHPLDVTIIVSTGDGSQRISFKRRDKGQKGIVYSRMHM